MERKATLSTTLQSQLEWPLVELGRNSDVEKCRLCASLREYFTAIQVQLPKLKLSFSIKPGMFLGCNFEFWMRLTIQEKLGNWSLNGKREDLSSWQKSTRKRVLSRGSLTRIRVWASTGCIQAEKRASWGSGCGYQKGFHWCGGLVHKKGSYKFAQKLSIGIGVSKALCDWGT